MVPPAIHIPNKTENRPISFFDDCSNPCAVVPKFDKSIVTLLFPARCLGCDKELPASTQPNDHDATNRLGADDVHDPFDFFSTFDIHWCRDCWRQLCNQSTPCCQKCGATLFHKNPLQEGCALCHDFDLRFTRAVAIGNYRGLLQDLVIRMKNQHDEQLATQLGNILAFQILASEFLGDLNLVVPVPTHWWRRVRRGFSAAEVIAERIARACDIPRSNHVLRCLRGTKKQGTLSTPGRIKNVRGAFDVYPQTSVSGLTILLIDDVMTSGATTSELARVLIREGAAKVYVGVIARGARVS